MKIELHSAISEQTGTASLKDLSESFGLTKKAMRNGSVRASESHVLPDEAAKRL